MCRILGVSRAQYYRYRSPKPSKRRAEDADLKQRILRIFAEFKQRYGVMKIHHELNLELQPLQLRCSPRRISRLMKELDIHSVTVNKWKAASASKTKVEQRPNLLKQDFSTTGLNQKWTADMTSIFKRSVMAGVTYQPSWTCTHDGLSAIRSQKRWILI